MNEPKEQIQYLKWVSLFFFIIVLPLLTFYMGVRYGETDISNEINSEEDISLEYESSDYYSDNKVEETKGNILGGFDDYGQSRSKYSIDNTYVYYDNKKISSDPSNFELLKGSLTLMKGGITYNYARDTEYVYYEGQLVEGADSKTFEPIENGRGAHFYGIDDKNVYYQNKVIVGAEPSTFKILWETIYEGCNKSFYSIDSKNVYLENNVVVGADPVTFEALINGYGKDKTGYYKGLKYIAPTLEPKNLVCEYG